MRRFHWISPAIIVALLCTGVLLQAQKTGKAAYSEDAGQSRAGIPTIRGETDLVLIPVSVRDATGRPVTDLEIKDFLVLENGKAVQLNHMGKPELTSLEVVLVFDLTSSLWFRFDMVKEAASGFVKSVFRPGDAVSIIGISSEPEILMKRTDSLEAIIDGIKKLPRFGAATAFFDAIIAGTRLYPNRPDPETRRVMVVLSDGEDNFSRKSLQQTLERIQKADCLFYSINPGISGSRLNRISRRGQSEMETLSAETGGTAFLAESVEALSKIYKRISDELQVQYLLGYNAPEAKTDEDYRTLSVSIPSRPELKVRARKGYYTD